MPTTVYTDGACLGNPGPGGWAWAIPAGPFASGAEPATTNQRMELKAALEAVRAWPGPLVVVSDSKYVVDCFNDRWYEAWERKGWRNSKREPVANQDLWKPLVELFHARGDELEFRWVKGHSGAVMNDVVDRLAVEAATTQAGREGSTPPTELGATDSPRAPRGAAGPSRLPVPEGHRVVVLGHKPPDLGGYGDNRVAGEVRRRLAEILAGLKALHPDLVVLTGLGLGAEQLGAEAAAQAGVPYVAVLPFPNPDEVWAAPSRQRYRDLLAGATATVTAGAAAPSSKQAAGMALAARDRGLVQQADGALVVWDGKDRHLGQLVAELEHRIPDEVWLVPPRS